MTASTLWFRGMKAGLTARIAACRVGGGLRFVAGPLPPACRPFVKGRRFGEQLPHLAIACRIERGVAQAAEGEGEIGLVPGHRVQEVLRQRLVVVALREQSELCAQPGLVGGVECVREAAERLLRLRDRLVLIVGQQRQQAFRKPRQVPERDPRLIAVGVAARAGRSS